MNSMSGLRHCCSPTPARQQPIDPIKRVQRSPAAYAKASSQTTPDGHPAMSLTDLVADLATICRNQLRIGT